MKKRTNKYWFTTVVDDIRSSSKFQCLISLEDCLAYPFNPQVLVLPVVSKLVWKLRNVGCGAITLKQKMFQGNLSLQILSISLRKKVNQIITSKAKKKNLIHIYKIGMQNLLSRTFKENNTRHSRNRIPELINFTNFLLSLLVNYVWSKLCFRIG